MFDKVLETIKQHNMLSRGERVQVAVSGGPDSVALLHCLWRLKDSLGIELHIAHLNHMLRGEDAEKDASFVKDLADNLGLPVTIAREDVRALLGEIGSEETAAREVRYGFLRRVARKYNCNKIALGHHADDQVETVLANFIHGSGVRGLGGMRPVNGDLIRPLLYIERQEIECYLKEQNLSWREDATNRETSYQRNRLRLELVPLLEQYNPRIRSALVQLADILRAEEQYLDRRAQSALKSICNYQQGEISLQLQQLNEMEAALQRRVIRLAYSKIVNNIREFSFQHVEMLREIAARGSGKAILPKHVEAEVQGNLLVLQLFGTGNKKNSRTFRTGFSKKLNIPGKVTVPGGFIEAEVSDIPDRLYAVPANEAYLDLTKLKQPLEVRNRKPCDFFYPLGLGGRKKLKDLFIDAGIPAADRDTVPVVLSEGEIVWVAGLRIDERFKVTANTSKTLHLNYLKAEIIEN